MNRSFVAFTAVASIGFILVMSTQSSRSAQSNTSPTLNAAKVSAAKTNVTGQLATDYRSTHARARFVCSTISFSN
jgi:hypothetical protein